METCRVILSGHNDAYFNMAMDEAILEELISTDPTPVLRIYGWDPEAFSFGVSQDPADVLNIGQCRKEDMAFVRRMTGGGLLFHSGDISYSIAASLKDLGCEGSVVRSYKIICQFLMEMYRGLDLEAGFAVSSDPGPGEGRAGINLCMASNEKYDILAGGRKLGGNAQKRRGSAILQHGSIPLKATLARSRSFVKDPSMVDSLRATSLGEAIGRQISYAEAEERLVESFKKVFSCKYVSICRRDDHINDQSAPFAAGLRNGALFNELLVNKYRANSWNIERQNDRKKTILAQ